MIKNKKNNLISIAFANNTHGIKGEFKISSSSSIFFNEISTGDKLFYFSNGEQRELIVKNKRNNNNDNFIVSFDNINSLNEAIDSNLKGNNLYIQRNTNDIYTTDLLDYEVEDNNGEKYEVVEILYQKYYYSVVFFKNDKKINIPIILDINSVEIDKINKRIKINEIEKYC